MKVVEIGSLPRFNWVVQRKAKDYLSDAAVRETALQDFYAACSEYGIDPSEDWNPYFSKPVYLMTGDKLTREEQSQLDTFAGYVSAVALAQIGLDEIYNGEQTRKEMSEAALEHIHGFEPAGRAVSWRSGRSSPSYQLFRCTGEPQIDAPYHQQERQFMQEVAQRLKSARGYDVKVKVIETGAVPLTIWNTDEYYYPMTTERLGEGKQAEYEARRQLIEALDTNVIIPVMQAHYAAGVDRLTIDLSRVSQHPEMMRLVIDSIGRMNDHAGGKFGLHFCFDNYMLIASSRSSDGRRIGDMENVDVLYIETANKDDGRGRDLSVYDSHIDAFRQNGYQGELALGYLNVHTNEVEPVELLVDRIKYAESADTKQPVVNPDCGLRTRPYEVAMRKLSNLREAADIVGSGQRW